MNLLSVIISFILIIKLINTMPVRAPPIEIVSEYCYNIHGPLGFMPNWELYYRCIMLGLEHFR